MAEVRLLPDDCEDERGERGERGHRGHRGPIGPTGPSGAAGVTGATGPTGPAATSPIAFANVEGAGITPSFNSQFGFVSVTNPSTGLYILTLANPPASVSDVIPIVTIGAVSDPGVSAFPSSPSTIDVQLFSGGVLTNANFFIAVYAG